jgi:Zn-dependent peptidase ImmA (M78 family)
MKMDRIIEEAHRVYRQYGSDDLDYVAEKLGAEIHENLDAGRLKEVYFPDLKTIVIRPGLPSHERNYLLAHALGHHLFHQEEGQQRDSFQQEVTCGSLGLGRLSTPVTEREADLFAAYLLVPKVKLKPLLQQDWIRESEDPALSLALEFRVPVELMLGRLVFEGLRR